MKELQRLADKVRSLRTALGLTQAQLATQLELDQARLSNIERGKRIPGLQQVERLAQILGQAPSLLVAGTDWVHPLDSNAAKAESTKVLGEFTRPFTWQPPCDRSMATQVRKALARHRDLTLWQLSSIRHRPDGARVMQSLAGVVAGSSTEAIFHLTLMAAGALLVQVAPLAVGFRQHPVVDPASRRGVGDCAVPAYRVDLEDLRCLLIPQVGMACRKCTWTVDLLCAVGKRRGAAQWFLVEIDGDGHGPQCRPLPRAGPRHAHHPPDRGGCHARRATCDAATANPRCALHASPLMGARVRGKWAFRTTCHAEEGIYAAARLARLSCGAADVHESRPDHPRISQGAMESDKRRDTDQPAGSEG